LRHIESPLFLSSLTLFVAGIVGMIHCGRRFIELWLQYAADEAVFRELAEALLNETTGPGHPA